MPIPATKSVILSASSSNPSDFAYLLTSKFSYLNVSVLVDGTDVTYAPTFAPSPKPFVLPLMPVRDSVNSIDSSRAPLQLLLLMDGVNSNDFSISPSPLHEWSSFSRIGLIFSTNMFPICSHKRVSIFDFCPNCLIPSIPDLASLSRMCLNDWSFITQALHFVQAFATSFAFGIMVTATTDDEKPGWGGTVSSKNSVVATSCRSSDVAPFVS
mmetsp:Transcript_4539/g.11712  ORF Transcript_4539/g.11712 Transcript_4539/m.11712 type:complete len:212 (+) Transcript_4539:2102-2737(+)